MKVGPAATTSVRTPRARPSRPLLLRSVISLTCFPNQRIFPRRDRRAIAILELSCPLGFEFSAFSAPPKVKDFTGSP